MEQQSEPRQDTQSSADFEAQTLPEDLEFEVLYDPVPFIAKVVATAIVLSTIGITLLQHLEQRIVEPILGKPILVENIPIAAPSPQSIASSLQNQLPSNLRYNVTTPTHLPTDPTLQFVVDDVINLVYQRGLPLESFSISLIDLNRHTSADYQAQVPRFPASLSKLFWMVALYAWTESSKLPAEYSRVDPTSCNTDLCKMIQKSDNEAASRIVDLLTHTASGQVLEEKAFTQWLYQREQLNLFFQQAGYTNINISQKNFPIPYLHLDAPQGPDLKMRGDPAHPTRNQITTAQAARLMYEIFSGQAVSPAASQQMRQLLTRTDLRTGSWINDPYNPIKGFLGEALPKTITFASKVGWTSNSRQDAAYIATADGRQYILVVFADHPAYGNDWEIFPAISRLVFDRMIAYRTG